MYLHCCLTLCDIWEPNIGIVNTLWEYYNKNLVSNGNLRELYGMFDGYILVYGKYM